jgi:hypothetical protein
MAARLCRSGPACDVQNLGRGYMKTIETTILVTPDGTVTLQSPANIPPGEYRIVVVIDERPIAESTSMATGDGDPSFVQLAASSSMMPTLSRRCRCRGFATADP